MKSAGGLVPGVASARRGLKRLERLGVQQPAGRVDGEGEGHGEAGAVVGHLGQALVALKDRQGDDLAGDGQLARAGERTLAAGTGDAVEHDGSIT